MNCQLVPIVILLDFTCICLVPASIINVSVPDNHTVGHSLTLQCEVIAGNGVTRTVDAVWISGGMELEKMTYVSSTTMDNSLVYNLIKGGILVM